MAAQFTASAKFVAIDKMSAVMRNMSRASQTFAKKTEVAFARLERRMNRLKGAIGGIGLAIGGALLIRAVTSVTGVFADFEQANASLASVMASATQPELVALQNDAKRLGAVTAKSASQVVSLQEAFARLGFGAKDIVNMTESTIAGSVAMQGELADTAELVGAMVSSFDQFSSVNAPEIIDQLTRSTQQSALNFEKLQTALPIVAGAANAAKVPFNRLLASLGKLSDAGIDASSSSTALRNIFLEAAKRGVPYQQLLDKVKNSTDQLATANQLFGKRGAVAAVILAKNSKGVEKLTGSLLVGKGAQEAAAKQLDTLKGRLTILNSAWEGFILSIEDGNGKIGQFLKTVVEVATEVLSLATGTAKLESELSDGEKRIHKIAKQAIFFLKTIKWLVIAMTALKVAILANKAIMIGANFIRFAMIFMKIAKAKSIWTAAQWALNIALNANPIGLIVIAIAALIGIIVLVVKHWDEITAAVKRFRDWLMKVLPIVDYMRDKWELLTASFKEGGIKAAIITIGKTMFDYMLLPLQKVLELLGKIPGLDIADAGAAKLDALRGKLFEDERALLPEGEQIQTTSSTAAQESISREERIINQSASLNINNNTGFDTSIDNPQGMDIKLSPTN